MNEPKENLAFAKSDFSYGYSYIIIIRNSSSLFYQYPIDNGMLNFAGPIETGLIFSWNTDWES